MIALYSCSSRRKITVFLFAVLTMMTIFGSLMYVIEGEANGFTSIPTSIYWAVVTMTTVGYGDISPQTAPGQALASLLVQGSIRAHRSRRGQIDDLDRHALLPRTEAAGEAH